VSTAAYLINIVSISNRNCNSDYWPIPYVLSVHRYAWCGGCVTFYGCVYSWKCVRNDAFTSF